MNFNELSTKHLNILKTKVQDTLVAKNLDSSGEAYRSIEVKGNQLLGIDYIYYLDKGRGPGGFPPISNLRDWIRSKLNIPVEEEKQAIFLIGRKISNEGTSIYKNSSKGLELDNLIDETLEEITKELPESAAAEALKWL